MELEEYTSECGFAWWTSSTIFIETLQEHGASYFKPDVTSTTRIRTGVIRTPKEIRIDSGRVAGGDAWIFSIGKRRSEAALRCRFTGVASRPRGVGTPRWPPWRCPLLLIVRFVKDSGCRPFQILSIEWTSTWDPSHQRCRPSRSSLHALLPPSSG